VDGKALPVSHFYHNDLTTTQDVISNYITTVCQPMVSTKGLLQWMATTLMVRSIEALPTSLCLAGNVCIEWAMDSPDPAAAGRDSNTMFDCTEYDNRSRGRCRQSSVQCDANPMAIVFASKECVGECCAITQNTCSAW
jgi:hypothetical protein